MKATITFFMLTAVLLGENATVDKINKYYDSFLAEEVGKFTKYYDRMILKSEEGSLDKASFITKKAQLNLALENIINGEEIVEENQIAETMKEIPEPINVADEKIKAETEKIVWTSPENVTDDYIIPIPDPVLKSRIYKAMNKELTEKLTFAEAKKIKKLMLSSYSYKTRKYDTNVIYDIKPLQYFVNLEDLNLFKNKISDMSALSGLTNLKQLTPRDNPFEDNSYVRSLKNLELYDSTQNRIENLSDFTHLPLLSDLSLSDLVNGDLSYIKSCKKMKKLYLMGGRLTDLSPITDFKDLVDLHISGQKHIKNIELIATFTKLESLWASSTQLKSLSTISQLTNLKHMNVSATEISSLDPIIHFTKLKALFIYNTKITNLTPLLTMFENGCFRGRSIYGHHLSVVGLKLDLRPNSPNRAVVDFLLSKKVKIEWKQGNMTE